MDIGRFGGNRVQNVTGSPFGGHRTRYVSPFVGHRVRNFSPFGAHRALTVSLFTLLYTAHCLMSLLTALCHVAHCLVSLLTALSVWWRMSTECQSICSLIVSLLTVLCHCSLPCVTAHCLVSNCGSSRCDAHSLSPFLTCRHCAYHKHGVYRTESMY